MYSIVMILTTYIHNAYASYFNDFRLSKTGATLDYYNTRLRDGTTLFGRWFLWGKPKLEKQPLEIILPQPS